MFCLGYGLGFGFQVCNVKGILGVVFTESSSLFLFGHRSLCKGLARLVYHFQIET
jgi:hypothetical protein